MASATTMSTMSDLPVQVVERRDCYHQDRTCRVTTLANQVQVGTKSQVIQHWLAVTVDEHPSYNLVSIASAWLLKVRKTARFFDADSFGARGRTKGNYYVVANTCGESPAV
jgi:hypothetical protein